LKAVKNDITGAYDTSVEIYAFTQSSHDLDYVNLYSYYIGYVNAKISVHQATYVAPAVDVEPNIFTMYPSYDSPERIFELK